MGDFKVVKILGEINTTLDIAGKSAATVATGDLVAIADIDDSNNIKKVTAQSIADLGAGFTSSSITGQTTVTPAPSDLLVIADASDSNALKKVTAQSLVNMAGNPVGTEWIVGMNDFTAQSFNIIAGLGTLGPFSFDRNVGGTGVSNGQANGINTDETFGINVFILPSSAGGFFTMATDVESIIPGDGTFRIGSRVRFEDLPVSGGDDYIWIMGFDTNANGLGSSIRALIGMVLTDNATNFVVKTHDGTTENVTDTGVAFAADTWYNMEIEMSPTAVSAWIDGSVVLDASTTNIPHAAPADMNAKYFGAQRVGTPSAVRNVYVDWAYMAWKPGTARGSLGAGNPWTG